MSSKKCGQTFAIIIHSDECFLDNEREFYEGFCAPLSPSLSLSLAFSTKWFFPGSSQCEEIAEIWAIEWERARTWEAAEESSTQNSQNNTISKPEGRCISLRFLLLEFGHATLFQCKGFNAAVVVLVMRIVENVNFFKARVWSRRWAHDIEELHYRLSSKLQKISSNSCDKCTSEILSSVHSLGCFFLIEKEITHESRHCTTRNPANIRTVNVR